MTPVSIEQLRATLQWKSIKVKSSQRQNWTAVSNIMVQTIVTSNHEDCNLVFTNHGKEDGIYPLKRDSKAQGKDQRSIVTTCKNTYKGVAFSTYWRHSSAIQRWNLIISTSLQDRAIRWYHCYLWHPSHSSLQVTTKSMKYWKSMYIPPINVKSCRSCQKQETQPKYDIVLSKLFMMTPQRALCVHLMR
jgi:hypothetical protein